MAGVETARRELGGTAFASCGICILSDGPTGRERDAGG